MHDLRKCTGRHVCTAFFLHACAPMALKFGGVGRGVGSPPEQHMAGTSRCSPSLKTVSTGGACMCGSTSDSTASLNATELSQGTDDTSEAVRCRFSTLRIRMNMCGQKYNFELKPCMQLHRARDQHHTVQQNTGSSGLRWAGPVRNPAFLNSHRQQSCPVFTVSTLTTCKAAVANDCAAVSSQNLLRRRARQHVTQTVMKRTFAIKPSELKLFTLKAIRRCHFLPQAVVTCSATRVSVFAGLWMP